MDRAAQLHPTLSPSDALTLTWDFKVEAKGLEPSNLLTASEGFWGAGTFTEGRSRRSTWTYCTGEFSPVRANPSPLLTQLLTFWHSGRGASP